LKCAAGLQRLLPRLVAGLITGHLLIEVIQNAKPITSRMTISKSPVPLYFLPSRSHASLISDALGFQHQFA